MFAANGWVVTTYGDTGSQLAIDFVSVYIGLAFWVVVFGGYTIWHKLRRRGQPMFVRWQDIDFDNGAVWGRGGGEEWKESERARVAEAKRQHGVVGYWLRRVKESLY